MQKRTAGSTRTVHNFFGENLEVVAVVVVLIADEIDQSRPSTLQANYLVAFTQCPKRHRTNRWIQSGNVASARKNADRALLAIRHLACPLMV